MIIQISSGQGPAECEYAVGKLLEALRIEFTGLILQSSVFGTRKDCYRSAILEGEEDLQAIEGSVQWICQSPFRPHHKRKNWYVDVSVVDRPTPVIYDDSLVRLETFRSPGKGGQHVNKVETGVRAIYVPLGLSVVSTEARSQQLNKKLALGRLWQRVADINQVAHGEQIRLNHLAHTRLQRGNPIRIYSGMDFTRIS